MADAEAKAAFEKMVEALNHQRIVSYMDIFSTTLLVYEVIINLQAEIDHIWMRKWTFFTVIYVLQRYLPLFDTAALTIIVQFGENPSPRYCILYYTIAAWSSIVGIMLSQIILTLRVWAVWNRDVTVATGLVIFFLACYVPCYIFFIQFLNAMEFATPLPSSDFSGCLVTSGSDILYLFWVLLMVYDTGTFIMILIPGVAAYQKGGRLQLIKTIYQDGVIYYALSFISSTIGMIVLLTLPQNLILIFTSFGRVLHSLLTSRVILHIRQVAWQSSTCQTISDLV